MSVELRKQDVDAIKFVSGGMVKTQEGSTILDQWPRGKMELLKSVALAGFDLREAAEDLLTDIHRRFIDEPLSCPFMQKLEEALNAIQAVGSGSDDEEFDKFNVADLNNDGG